MNRPPATANLPGHPEDSPTMDLRDGFIGAIGNTPLIRLARLSEGCGCVFLCKAEFLNPGSSVKDRGAWYIVTDAEV